MGRIWLARRVMPVLPTEFEGFDTTVLIRSQVCAVVSCGAAQAEAERTNPAASRAVVSFFMIPSVVDVNRL